MYSYIKGIIEEIDLEFFVIENNDIGYKINASSNTIKKLVKGEKTKIYTKLIVKEDDMSLCGFYDKEELGMFNLLTSVSKIGVKVGLSILSCATPKVINGYIVNSDAGSFSKVPGIGKKTAERIILELKDKIDKYNVEFEENLITEKNTENNIEFNDEAVEALISLGYSNVEAKEAVNKSKGKTTEETIKKALSYILSKQL